MNRSDGDGETLTDSGFAARMAAFDPFEPAPRLAVALSGGADSHALARLADSWARKRGGAVTALIVDHRLRDTSTDEAARVAGWMTAAGIDHRILVREGPRPATGLQAAARQARYRLLGEACRQTGILHLLLAHHRDDQAETIAIRLEDASGSDGLAGMADRVETPWGRLLRPLLDVPRRRLRATLEAAGLPWIDDPSNLDQRFARVRLRAALTAERSSALLAESAGHASDRRRREVETARLLATACQVDAAGFARLDANRLAAAGAEWRRRVLGRLSLVYGGATHVPGAAALRRLDDRLTAVGGGTLGGARFAILDTRTLLVCREVGRGRPEPVAACPGRLVWDNRFEVRFDGRVETLPEARLGPLGEDGWRAVAAVVAERGGTRIPVAARAALPCLRAGGRVVAVPHLDVFPDAMRGMVDARFRPPLPLAGWGFSLASCRSHTIS